MDASDHYRTLQVDPEAEFEVIRAAYRALAAKNHPDLGGSPERMTALNAAWHVLSKPASRAAYDLQRRLRDGGARWDAYAPSAAERDRATGTIIDYGRYTGWSIPEVARVDPDYLLWLARTPSGRRYRAEIEALEATPVRAAAPPRRHSGLRCKFGLG